jgi:hypothetical protein
MSVDPILNDFRAKLDSAIEVEQGPGLHRYQVHTPFVFDDGDELGIVLTKDNDHWTLSDEGATFWHLTYALDERDLQQGTRAKIIESVLTAFSVENNDGELRLAIPDDRYGDALYSFVQAILKITDVRYLSRERIRSTFVEDLAALIDATVPAQRRKHLWYDSARDPRADYTVDWRVDNNGRPLFVYAIPNDDHARDATISLLQFEKWRVPHFGVGIFEDQEAINRRVLARFSDVCDKQFSSLGGNEDRIMELLTPVDASSESHQ